MQNRVILHCDCNNFYASVELLKYPKLRDVPVAISGSEDSRHGIILAKNEVAKKYNIKTAEAVWQAVKKCPDLVLLPPHRKEYQKYYHILNEIYQTYTDLVEPFGIDESWLDITGSWKLFGETPKDVADELRLKIHKETGLSISVGLSFNKVFAKLGSDYKKPNATTEITTETYKDILWPLPAEAMLGVGHKAAKILKEVGINTIAQLADADKDLLSQLLGKQGLQMNLYAQGLDDAPVRRADEIEPVKSVGNGMTFRRNLHGYQDIRIAVGSLADEVAGRLRAKKLYAQNLQIIIKDTNLKSISRQRILPYATCLAKDFVTVGMDIIKDNWNMEKPIRMITLTAQNLTDMPLSTQITFFDNEEKMDEKREKLERSIDKIRNKFGKAAILEAGALRNDLGVSDKAGMSEDDSDDIISYPPVE